MNLKEIGTLLRKGRITDAQAALRKVSLKSVPRELRLELAFIAREARLPHTAVAALHSVVRPEHAGLGATEEERAEYAVSLAAIGCIKEARELIAGLDFAQYPTAGMATINAYFREWDWGLALPVIDQMLCSPQLRKRQILSLRLDRAICLMYGHQRFSECREVITTLLSEIDGVDFAVLRFDSYLIQAISHYLEKNWVASLSSLKKMDAVFGDQATAYLKNVSKLWHTFIQLNQGSRTSGRSSLLQATDRLREFFIALGRPNFARFCDYFPGLALRDTSRLLRLIYGSSASGVTSRALLRLRELGGTEPPSFDLPLGLTRKTKPIVVDLQTPRTIGLKAGQLQHRLLCALLDDIYARPNISQIFSLVYPSEYYSPTVSPLKIAGGLFRLRKTFVKLGIPIVIRELNGFYWLDATVPIRIRVSRRTESPKSLSEAALRTEISDRFGEREFSSIDFSDAFGVSERTARYRLSQACAQGWLKRSGRGKATRYKSELKDRHKRAR